jgi:hypothetical protein
VTQYSVTLLVKSRSRGVLDLPAFAGMTTGCDAAPYAISYENSRDRDARHNVHSVRNLEGIRGANGSLSARDIRINSLATSLSGRNTGLTCGGTVASSAKAVLTCPCASPTS